MEPSEPDALDAPRPGIEVTVTRTGGIAGLRRTWTAEADDDAGPWVALIQRCPWDDAAARSAPGADRFVWRVSATCGERAHDAELADSEVVGPWRELIDAVRAATGSAR